ncbi:MAG: S-4TM family putative pore-forming effector [Methanothrix sp.]|nr:S-4TM family putative pore-forming effector [Methanothrix sp.]
MSDIPERQNEDRFLRYLAAQRQLYTEDKRVGYGSLISIAIATIIGTFIQLFLSEVAGCANLAVLVLATLGLLIPMLSQSRTYAANVQERFDCSLLQIEWNDALAEEPEEMIISQKAARFQGSRDWHQATSDLRDWYENPHIVTDPLAKARIACQMENIGYSHRQGRWWAVMLMATVVVLFLFLIFIGMSMKWTITQLFLGPVPLFAPLMIGAVQNAAQHLEAASKLDRLSRIAQVLWHDAQGEYVDEMVLTQRARALQNEIYHLRRDYLPVPDWWYNLLRRLN